MRDFLPNLPFFLQGLHWHLSVLTWDILGDWQLNSRSLETYYAICYRISSFKFLFGFFGRTWMFSWISNRKIGDALKNPGKTMFSLKPAAFLTANKNGCCAGHHGWSGLGSFGTRCTKRCVPDADPEVVILGRVPKVKSIISFWNVLYIIYKLLL